MFLFFIQLMSCSQVPTFFRVYNKTRLVLIVLLSVEFNT